MAENKVPCPEVLNCCGTVANIAKLKAEIELLEKKRAVLWKYLSLANDKLDLKLEQVLEQTK
jgi:hypothetical protein